MAVVECDKLGAGDDEVSPVGAIVVAAAGGIVVEELAAEGWKEVEMTVTPETSTCPSSLRRFVPRVVLSLRFSLLA